MFRLRVPAGTRLFTAPHHTDVNLRIDCGATEWDTWIIKTKTVTGRDELPNIKSITNPSTVSASELFNDKSLDDAIKFAEAPTSFPESQQRPDCKHWKEATIRELNTLAKNESWWDVVKSKIPSGVKILPSRFVYRVKFNKLGEILKYKARLVVKGYAQIFGQDYFATFAPVAQLTSLRLLLIICAQLNLTTFHIDFEAAFVQSNIDTDIYVSYPHGYKVKNKHGETLFMKLRKSLYGLKQAPRNWNIKLTTWLKKYGFKQSMVDPCFFYFSRDGVLCYINVYVDDLPGGHNNQKWFNKFIRDMKKEFNVGTVDKLEWVMQVEVKKIDNGFQFCHQKYIKDLLRRFNMEHCKPLKVPLEPGFEISSHDSPTNPETQARLAKSGYRELLGSLLWIARVSRPDIQAAVSILCRFASNPSERHLKALRGILAYLSGTSDKGGLLHKDSF